MRGRVLGIVLTGAWTALAGLPSCSSSGSHSGDASTDGTPDSTTPLDAIRDGGTIQPCGDASSDAPRDARAQSDTSADAPTLDGGPLTAFCAAFKSYAMGCGTSGLCAGGPGFSAACNPYDEQVSSTTYRESVMGCLAKDDCDPDTRHACEYSAFTGHTPTAAQSKLVADYCATCAGLPGPPDASTLDGAMLLEAGPGDAGIADAGMMESGGGKTDAAIKSCVSSALTYDVDAGPGGASIIFLAAWQYSDALTSEIDSHCTEAALAVPDGGACDEVFNACARNYLFADPAFDGFEICY